MKHIFSSPVRTLLALSVLLTLVLFLVTIFWDFLSSVILPNTSIGLYSKSFWESFLVEMHGIAFELSVIGVLLIWLDTRRNKTSGIKRLQEDLDDYAMLDFPEVNVKKLGHIKRLNDYGITSVNVQNLILNELKLKGIKINGGNLIGLKVINGSIVGSIFTNVKMRSSNFQGSTIKSTPFKNCHLLKSNFVSAHCKGVDFSGSCLERVDFTNTDLQSSIFNDCDVREAKFEGANLKHASFHGASFLKAQDLARAKNLDYIKVPEAVLEELIKLRLDMKYQIKKGRP